MGFCHSVVKTDDILLGDILEIEMVKSSPFDLNSNFFKKLIVYDFESALQRMSVVV